MSWWTKRTATEVTADAVQEPRHVAIGYADAVQGARQMVNAATTVCGKLGLTMRTVENEPQLIAAAQDMTSAQVVVFPHFDTLTAGAANLDDPSWGGVKLSPAAASAAGVTYVVGTTGQDGDTLHVLRTIFGAHVKSMSLLNGSATELSALELMLEETLGS